MGKNPAEAPALPQTRLQVLPTRTIYDFEDGQVHVHADIPPPALPDDLEALALPLSYITWEVRSVDGNQHTVSLYDSTSSQLAVNQPGEKVEWAREPAGKLDGAQVRHGDTSGTRLLRGRPPYQLGLCLRRRAGRTGQGRHRQRRAS